MDHHLPHIRGVHKTGAGSDWDVTSKAAYLHYYRMYFLKDEAKREQANRAYLWIQRALALNPLHADLTIKQADVLGELGRHVEAVALLEGLSRRPEAPAYVKQWLGYMYLFVDRIEDSLNSSKQYLAAFPEDNDARFNIACAYAQQFGEGVRNGQGKAHTVQKAGEEALTALADALRREPGYWQQADKWKATGESFEAFKGDKDLEPRFDEIIADAKAIASARTSDK